MGDLARESTAAGSLPLHLDREVISEAGLFGIWFCRMVERVDDVTGDRSTAIEASFENRWCVLFPGRDFTTGDVDAGAQVLQRGTPAFWL